MEFDREKAIAAAERVRKVARSLDFQWLEDDANQPDDAPRELTPWMLLACAALDMGA